MRVTTRLFLCFLLSGLWVLFFSQPLAAQQGAQKQMPNIFTPNNDGINDTLELESTQPLTFSVFNRGGALVYQVVAKHVIWDGTDEHGRELADGVYFYVLQDPAHTYKQEKGIVYISRSQVKEITSTPKKKS